MKKARDAKIQLGKVYRAWPRAQATAVFSSSNAADEAAPALVERTARVLAAPEGAVTTLVVRLALASTTLT